MEEQEIVSYVVGKRLTMTSYERLWATLMACKHVISANIEGDFVECGVWRGGHALLAAAIFKLHKCERNLFLFDTFEGMTKPTDRDRQFEDNGFAMEQYQGHDAGADNAWCYSSLQDVTWISELNRRS
ncbi:TylF/MycF/NovP-related O-methyltransferase [uncultured Thiodictyon sp.]|uniref:TylF/MycF/NovP-related O-methyltransferase n=1 Tax=uncultured Thiodictyon sp. TaxID=1846217 RepID=UPI0025EC9D46|nr:TylF/MycF/NovP-related O-methyltransferase [uncultured Thiodictyon sp.]